MPTKTWRVKLPANDQKWRPACLEAVLPFRAFQVIIRAIARGRRAFHLMNPTPSEET